MKVSSLLLPGAIVLAGLIAACEGLHISGEAEILDNSLKGRISRDRETNDFRFKVPAGYEADVKVTRADGSTDTYSDVKGEVLLANTSTVTHMDISVNPIPPLPPPPPAGGGSGGGMLQGTDSTQAVTNLREPIEHWLWRIDVAPSFSPNDTHVSATFSVRAVLRDDTLERLILLTEPMLQFGPGAVLPPNVELLSWVQMTAVANGAILLLADVTPSFSSFNVTWNGNDDFAGLTHDSAFSDRPNGWHVAEVFIPHSAMVFDATSCDNEATIEWKAPGDTRASRMTSHLVITP